LIKILSRARLAAPNFTTGTTLQGANSLTTSSGDLSLVQAGAPGPLVINGSFSNLPASTPQKPTGILPARPNLPEDPVIPHNGFLTYEEGEKAFFHLLRKAGVDATWTWEQTMRAIITDPLYKALNSLAERKAATHKVCLVSSVAYVI
jgi:pre-mRNA-processing factor 40